MLKNFEKIPWLKPYTDYITKRAATKNKFSKELHKLLNNAFYGRTTEKACNRKNLKLMHADDYQGQNKEQNIASFKGKEFYGDPDYLSFNKQTVTLSAPISIGFGIKIFKIYYV